MKWPTGPTGHCRSARSSPCWGRQSSMRVSVAAGPPSAAVGARRTTVWHGGVAAAGAAWAGSSSTGVDRQCHCRHSYCTYLLTDTITSIHFNIHSHTSFVNNSNQNCLVSCYYTRHLCLLTPQISPGWCLSPVLLCVCPQ